MGKCGAFAGHSYWMGTEARYAEVAAIGFLLLLVFSIPTERAAIAAGNDLRGLRICHQQAFWQEIRERIPAKIRNLTELHCLRTGYYFYLGYFRLFTSFTNLITSSGGSSAYRSP